MNSQDLNLAVRNQLPELMLQCSCSTCDYNSFFAKRQDHPCACNVSSKNSSFLIVKEKGFDNFDSCNSKKLEEKVTKEFDDERMESNNPNKNGNAIINKDYIFILKEQPSCIVQDNNHSTAEKQYLTSKKSGQKINLSTAKLSAQIMNVPYRHFEESVTQRRKEQVQNLHKISFFDLIQRIKDVYKACSCKVCDCIVGITQKNELCNCKPCDCDECTNFKKKATFSKNNPEFIQWSEFGETMIKEEDCNCKPCECIQCADTTPKSCACEPCQCIECYSHQHYKPQTLIVAPVGDDNQAHQTCDCLPCDCFQCSHRFGISSNAVRHEMSTGLNRHLRCRCDTCVNEACLPDSNDTCRCERRDKVVRKPVQRDKEYDVRRAELSQHIKHKYRNKSDMITMYTVISNKFSSYLADSIRNECNCNQCECLDCTYNKYSANLPTSSNNFISNNINNTSRDVNCKCSTCECEFCSKNDIQNCKLLTLTNIQNTSCKCDKCDCLSCDKVHRPINNNKSIRKFCSLGKCACSTCECTDCDRMMTTCLGGICECRNCKCERCLPKNDISKIIYPIKKTDKLVPTSSKQKRSGTFNDVKVYQNTYDDKTNVIGNIYSAKFCDTLMNSFNSKQQYYPKPNTEAELTQHVQRPVSLKYITNETSKVNKLEPLNLQNFRLYESTNSLMAYVKDSNNESLNSDSGSKSVESLYKGSGHEYSNCKDYFQKTPVEACLNDIMKLNIIDHDIKLEPFNIGEKYNHITKPLDISKNFYNNEHVKYQLNDKNGQISKTYSRDIITDSLSNNNSFPSEQGKASQYCFVVEETTCNAQRSQVAVINNLAVDEDYLRVQKTLEDSRKYSEQLLNLLESYEKANREFESVSQKLKQNHEIITALKQSISQSSEKLTPKHNIVEKFNSIEDVPVKDVNKSSKFEEIQECVSVENDRNEETNILLSSNETKKSKNVGNEESCGTESIIPNNHSRLKKSDYSSLNNSDISLADYKINLNPICEENELSGDHHAGIEMKPIIRANPLKGHVKISKRAIMLPIKNRRISTKEKKEMFQNFTPTNRITYDTEKNHKHEAFNRNKQLTKKTINSEKDKDTNSDMKISLITPINNSKSDTEMTHVMSRSEMRLGLVQQHKEMKTLTVLKKNFCLNVESETAVKKLCTQPLENELKEAVKYISCQAKNNIYTEFCEHNALVQVREEVKKLLELPLLHKLETAMKDYYSENNLNSDGKGNVCDRETQRNQQEEENCTSLDVRKNEIETNTTHSCDAMKVSFLTVRKVSDHTIMVKWNTPRLLKNVRGYEILVNGRAVQKILNVSRCMVVVTCVPNTEKILLTVRTVTTSKCKCGHNPSTTVVYRPRLSNVK